MYTNITKRQPNCKIKIHFLYCLLIEHIIQMGNQKENSSRKIPKPAREISAFFSLIIDETLEQLPLDFASTGIRCFRKGCFGIISSRIDFERNQIHWKCSDCRNSGTISGIYKSQQDF